MNKSFFFFFSYDEPIVINRGDEIEVVCTFDTSTSTDPVYFGLSTASEMCFMVAQVYPYDSSIPVFCGVLASTATQAAIISSMAVLGMLGVWLHLNI